MLRSILDKKKKEKKEERNADRVEARGRLALIVNVAILAMQVARVGLTLEKALEIILAIKGPIFRLETTQWHILAKTWLHFASRLPVTLPHLPCVIQESFAEHWTLTLTGINMTERECLILEHRS